MSSPLGTDIEEDLIQLDARMKMLRNEYEQYFLGSRKREPQLLRGEVQKIINYYANVPIRNTGHRFKFNNLRARYFAFRRHWDDTQRKIEDGTLRTASLPGRAARARARHRGGQAEGAHTGGAGRAQRPRSALLGVDRGARRHGQPTAGLTARSWRRSSSSRRRPSASVSARGRCASAWSSRMAGRS